MHRCRDTGAADWLATVDAPWWQVATFGPPGFEAYARLRFIPDPVRAGQRESDVIPAADHPTDLDQTRRALRVLEQFTGTPDECYFCEWDGYGGDWLRTTVDGSEPPFVTIPHRRYGLFVGRLAEIHRWADQFGQELPPAFVWPADRSWCFAGDVDPHWAGLGVTRAALEALVAAPDIDVVAADPTRRQPSYH